MRVLMVHNRYRVRGGEDEAADAETDLLERAGVEVDRFILDNREVTDAGLMRGALRAVWSNASYRAVRDRLARKRHDIVHVQNFFPLISPSVHWAARAAAVPVIQDLHNYRLACLNGYFFRSGQICESCAGKLPWRGVMHACYRDSVLGSSIVASMLAAHRIAGTWQDKVDLFITPSNYAKRKLSVAIPAERVAVNPNFVVDQGAGNGAGGFALLVGRLSPEKGIITALNAWSAHGTGLPELRIAGDGPLQGDVLHAAAQRSNISYLGRRSLPDVLSLMASAKLLLFPSECYETFGRTVIEAMSVGTPVVCSRGGAHTELVSEGVTGTTFASGRTGGLVAAVMRLIADPDRYAVMRRNAREAYLASYTPERHRETLLAIYARVLRSRTGKAAAR